MWRSGLGLPVPCSPRQLRGYPFVGARVFQPQVPRGSGKLTERNCGPIERTAYGMTAISDDGHRVRKNEIDLSAQQSIKTHWNDRTFLEDGLPKGWHRHPFGASFSRIVRDSRREQLDAGELKSIQR